MSGAVGILCSGQGGQHREMFACLGDVSAASGVFGAAACLLGADPRRFVRDADEGALFSNRAGQILCCTQALAAWAMLGEHRPADIVLAGYSVGELAAWGCAGLLTPDQVLRLAAERAAAMDAAAPDGAGLAAIVGLRRTALDPLLDARDVHVAIVNAADSVVVGGPREGLEACLHDARRRGATARVLRVAVPSHTRLLAAAAQSFGRTLAAEPLGRQDAGIRLLSGIDGETVRDPRAGLRKLAAQVSTTVDWASCLERCREARVSTFLELGPGSALSRMAERLSPGVRARSVEEFRTERGIVDWLALG